MQSFESFQHLSSWINDAKNLARKECSIVIVGNKSDLSDNRVIKYNEGAKFCQENGNKTKVKKGLIFFECSALSGEYIDEIFDSLVKQILNKVEEG